MLNKKNLKLLTFSLIIVILGNCGVFGYTPDNGIELRDTVVMSYVGKKLADGEVFDTNDEATFIIDRTQLIPGFVDGILGLKIGESKIFEVPPERGYQSGDLAGIVLVFEVEILQVTNYTPTSESLFSNSFIQIITIIGGIFAGVLLLIFALLVIKAFVVKTGTKCTVCGAVYEGVCSKCNKPYCRADFGMKCSCGNRIFTRK